MKKEDNLHLLIHSLNSQEKRLFKLYVSTNQKGKNNNYIKLFDSLSQLKEYDEVKLKNKLKNTTICKNLTQNKKYLKDLILKSVRDIEEDRAEDKVTILMKEQVFLNKKNLFKEQWKKLQKAKEIAQKQELFGRHLEILDHEMSFLYERDFKKALDNLPIYKTNKNILIDKINLYNKIIISKNVIFHFIRKYQNKIDKENLEIAQKEITQYDVKKILESDSLKIKGMYYNTIANYHNLAKDAQKAFDYRQKLVQLYEEYPHFKTYKTNRYIIDFFNYIGAIFKIGNYPLLKKELDFIATIDIKNENNKGEFYQNHTLYSLLYAMNTGKLQEAIENSEMLKFNLNKYRKKINTSSLLTLYYNYALIFFFAEDFDNSILWLEKIKDMNVEVRMDLQSFARLLTIICHFELGHALLIESLCRSAKRGFKFSSIEKSICNSLLKLTKSNKTEQEYIFEKINILIREEKDRIVGKSILIIWINSHLSKKEGIHSQYLKSIEA